MTRQALTILYDGECPFCSRYVAMVRIRETYDVRLLDARTHPEAVARHRAAGRDIDDGMIVEVGDHVHYGADAIAFLSAVSGPWGALNRVFAWLFRSRRVTRMLYPVMKIGRRATLLLMRRSARI
ncbi:MAG: DCC1-like thiol-disulfide oxidoreductase family protein [Pseudomonadota bacterium]